MSKKPKPLRHNVASPPLKKAPETWLPVDPHADDPPAVIATPVSERSSKLSVVYHQHATDTVAGTLLDNDRSLYHLGEIMAKEIRCIWENTCAPTHSRRVTDDEIRTLEKFANINKRVGVIRAIRAPEEAEAKIYSVDELRDIVASAALTAGDEPSEDES